jgi:hypothetical protein
VVGVIFLKNIHIFDPYIGISEFFIFDKQVGSVVTIKFYKFTAIENVYEMRHLFYANEFFQRNLDVLLKIILGDRFA